MQHRFFYIILLSFLPFCVWAQGAIEEFEPLMMQKHKIQTITVWTQLHPPADQVKDMPKSFLERQKREQYSLNDKGQATKRVAYYEVSEDADGNALYSDFFYEYDLAGRLKQEKNLPSYYKQEGKTTTIVTAYDYNQPDAKISTITETKIYPNTSKKEVSTTKIADRGSMKVIEVNSEFYSSMTIEQYNHIGQLTRLERFYGKAKGGGADLLQVFTYDADGKLVKKVDTSPQNPSTPTLTVTYEYDHRKLLTKRIENREGAQVVYDFVYE